MRLPSLAVVAVVCAGCAHRGMRMPGPTGRMGSPPPAYGDTLEEEPAPEAAPEVAEIAPEARPGPKRRRARGDGAAVARAAGELVGRTRLTARGETFRYDCSGMVEAAHARAGTRVTGSSRDLFEDARAAGLLHRRKIPEVGDVAFFDDTYDRNHNRRRDDDLTHVAVVESVDRDGTITLVHKGSRGVVRISMNLKRPHERRDESGRELNDYLRASSDRDNGPTLSGELWRAFGSLWALQDDAVADGG